MIACSRCYPVQPRHLGHDCRLHCQLFREQIAVLARKDSFMRGCLYPEAKANTHASSFGWRSGDRGHQKGNNIKRDPTKVNQAMENDVLAFVLEMNALVLWECGPGCCSHPYFGKSFFSCWLRAFLSLSGTCCFPEPPSIDHQPPGCLLTNYGFAATGLLHFPQTAHWQLSEACWCCVPWQLHASRNTL